MITNVQRWAEALSRDFRDDGVQGATIDEDAKIVTFYTTRGKRTPALPAKLDQYDVELCPLPKAVAF